MTSTTRLIKEINQTDAQINAQLNTIDEGLSKPACYVLPAIAFVLGFSMHHKVPMTPLPLIAWLSKARLF